MQMKTVTPAASSSRDLEQFPAVLQRHIVYCLARKFILNVLIVLLYGLARDPPA